MERERNESTSECSILELYAPTTLSSFVDFIRLRTMSFLKLLNEVVHVPLAELVNDRFRFFLCYIGQLSEDGACVFGSRGYDCLRDIRMEAHSVEGWNKPVLRHCNIQE